MGKVLKFVNPEGGLKKNEKKSFASFAEITQF